MPSFDDHLAVKNFDTGNEWFFHWVVSTNLPAMIVHAKSPAALEVSDVHVLCSHRTEKGKCTNKLQELCCRVPPSLNHVLQTKKNTSYSQSIKRGAYVLDDEKSCCVRRSSSEDESEEDEDPHELFSLSRLSHYSQSTVCFDDILSIPSMVSRGESDHPLIPRNDETCASELGDDECETSDYTPLGDFIKSLKRKISTASLFTTAVSKSAVRFNQLTLVSKTPIDLKEQISQNSMNFTSFLNDNLSLELFKTKPSEPCDCSLSSSCHAMNNKRSRECRVNSNFLKLYAIDFSVKSSWDYERYDLEYYEQLFEESSYDSHNDFLSTLTDNEKLKMNIKVGLLSKEKLWNHVILEPRNDPLFNNKSNYYVEAFHHSSNNSIVRNQSNFLPWINLSNYKTLKSIPPHGKLPNNIQYTVNGWCNERWIENRDL